MLALLSGHGYRIIYYESNFTRAKAKLERQLFALLPRGYAHYLVGQGLMPVLTPQGVQGLSHLRSTHYVASNDSLEGGALSHIAPLAEGCNPTTWGSAGLSVNTTGRRHCRFDGCQRGRHSRAHLFWVSVQAPRPTGRTETHRTPRQGQKSFSGDSGEPG